MFRPIAHAAGLPVTGHTANSLPVADAGGTLADVALAASKVLGRKAAGGIVALSPAELAGLFGAGDGTKFLADDGTLKTPAGGGAPTFERSVFCPVNALTESTGVYHDVDAVHLPALSLNAKIGEVIEWLFCCNCYADSAGAAVFFDAVITLPDASTTTFRALMTSTGAGAVVTANTGAYTEMACIVVPFTATQNGVHSFKPQWRSQSGTAKIQGSSTDAYAWPVTHMITNKGAPT